MQSGLVVLVALFGACFVGPVDYSNTRFACDDDGICPSGFECVAGVCVEPGTQTDGAPTAGFQRELTVDHAAGAAALVDFPLMIRLDPSRIEYEVCQPDGSDVRFVDAAGDPLAHEIERWNPGGVSILWLEVPRIEPEAAGARVVMQYGDGNRGDPDPRAVWSNHAAVYHLADGSDSSSSGFDGTLVGPPAAIDGIVGPALNFPGGGELVDLGTDRPFLRAQPAATASAWVRLASDWAAPGAAFASSIDGMGMPTNASRLQILVLDDRSFEGDARSMDGGSIVNVIGPMVPTETWTYLAYTIDFANARIELFIDGVSVAVGENLLLDASSADSVSTQTTIGRGEQEGVDLFNGDIDEVRLSHALRTPDEIAADYQSMTDRMVTFGPAVAIPSP